jgi:hypothetical protein
LALQLFTKVSHINLLMLGMKSAEPWLYAAVVHEREQTYHGIELCSELWSTGAKAVSFLPSRPTANLISGGGQLPKLAAPELVAGCATAALSFAGVEDEDWPLWRTGQNNLKGTTRGV